jgi:hypothetical protein
LCRFHGKRNFPLVTQLATLGSKVCHLKDWIFHSFNVHTDWSEEGSGRGKKVMGLTEWKKDY